MGWKKFTPLYHTGRVWEEKASDYVVGTGQRLGSNVIRVIWWKEWGEPAEILQSFCAASVGSLLLYPRSSRHM